MAVSVAPQRPSLGPSQCDPLLAPCTVMRWHAPGGRLVLWPLWSASASPSSPRAEACLLPCLASPVGEWWRQQRGGGGQEPESPTGHP